MNVKKIFFLLSITFTFLAISKSPVQAQVKYPISELGNCRDQQECFYYCEVPANHDVCTAYANKSQVLGESTQSAHLEKTALITFPIAELGNCSSVADCSAFCSKAENKTTCSNFFQKKGISTKTETTHGVNTQKIAADAKAYLGCDYLTTCKDFCNKQENHKKCEDFAKKEGLNQSSAKSQQPTTNIPTDCNNPANKEKCASFGFTCMNFCAMYPDKCPTISKNITPVVTGKQENNTFAPGTLYSRLREKTGCSTTQDCSNYCKEHIDFCRSLYNTQAITKVPTAVPFHSESSGTHQ